MRRIIAALAFSLAVLTGCGEPARSLQSETQTQPVTIKTEQPTSLTSKADQTTARESKPVLSPVANSAIEASPQVTASNPTPSLTNPVAESTQVQGLKQEQVTPSSDSPTPTPSTVVSEPAQASNPNQTGSEPSLVAPAGHSTLILELLASIRVVPESHGETYDRDDWGKWIDADGDGCDTREEVLMDESTVAVSLETGRCRIASGRWMSVYDSTETTDRSQVHIDHVVALREAHDSGGYAWNEARRLAYYNNLDDPRHLIAVSAQSNLSKGARDPAEWMPSNTGYHCTYASDWVMIKHAWGLTIDSEESKVLVELFTGACEGATVDGPAIPPADLQIYATCEAAEAAGETRSLGSTGAGLGFPVAMVPSASNRDGDDRVCEVDKQPTVTVAPTGPPFATCEAAEAAGIPRLQGSSGSGRGFPAAVVPSARDGDNDGVVCEV